MVCDLFFGEKPLISRTPWPIPISGRPSSRAFEGESL